MNNYTIESLEDFRIPLGLLPDLETFFIREQFARIINKLNGITLEDIKHDFNIFNEMKNAIAEFKDKPEFDIFLMMKNHIVNKRNDAYDRPFVIPEKSPEDETFIFLIEILKQYKNSPGELIDIPGSQYLHERLFKNVESSERIICSISLYLYFIATRKAKALKNDYDPYTTLGKVSKYFVFSYLLLEFTSYLTTEFNAIKMKEVEHKEGKAAIAKNASRAAYKQKNLVKRKLIEAYIAEKENNKKIVKAHFVRMFIEQLSNEENREFAPTNIHRNLTDTISQYEKGNLSVDIWP